LGKIQLFLKKYAAVILIILFIAALAPMFAISAYDHPYSDDYTFSVNIRNVLAGGGTAWGVLKAAAQTTAGTFKSWQGSFSAVFLMCFQPEVFAEGAYALVPFIMLGALIICTFKLLYTVISRCLKLGKKNVIYVGVPVLFVSTQCLPSISQGFYWYNGAVYYTFFYALMLLFVDALILCIKGERKTPKGAFTALLILAVVIGGGNYVTAFACIITGFAIMAYCIAKKRLRLPVAVTALAVLLISFFISALAPGNAVRQAKVTSINPLLAILYSVLQAFADIAVWSTPVVILIFILLTPLLYKMASGLKYSFRRPWALLICSFLFFAAQNAPPYYAMNWAGDGRLRDIVFYSYVWLVLVNLFYYIGWFQRRPVRAVSGNAKAGRKLRPALLICAAALLPVMMFLPPFRTAGIICAGDIAGGQAEAFSRVYFERLSLYEDKNLPDVSLPQLTARPKALFVDDIRSDPKDFRNKTMALYYDKKSVSLSEAH
jgi:hypothetical protein